MSPCNNRYEADLKALCLEFVRWLVKFPTGQSLLRSWEQATGKRLSL